MDELARKIEEKKDALEVRWDDRREREIDRALHARLVRRSERRRAAVAIAAVAVLGVSGATAAWRLSPGEEVARTEIEGAVELADGSIAIPVGRGASVKLMEERADLARVSLERGAARFDVTRAEERTFRVEAGPVSVEVLGTSFVVARGEPGEGERVRVEVVRGRVGVRWQDGEAVLAAGDEGLYPPVRPAAAATPDPEPEPNVEPATTAAAPPATASSSPAWRTLARDGDYEAAWTALEAAGEDAVRDETAELLLAADVARLTHHPEASVSPLRRITERHRGDPRAGLAAFTLGRVLLEELGRPREAALTFADARALDANGSLAEDALAREVESWARAGDAARAEERAREYVAQYPEGRRLRSVRHQGGLE
jgi:transmembrane sensor